MRNSLDGLLVVSLEQAVAAPYVSGRLADAGARVIKIEREEGDFARRYDAVAHGESAYFVWLNRGKESLVLDIKKTEDAALLHRIISKADIFIQNLAPGAATRSGFDSLALRQQHPRLITCDISGYGEEGHYSKRKAYDLLVQAETGLASITGRSEGPGRVGVSVCDIAAGMHALTGILQALYEREQTGAGKGVKVSLFDGMADWMTVPLLHQEYTGKPPERVGLNHPSIAPYGAYECGDGAVVVLSIQNEREWVNLCNIALEKPELIENPNYATNPLRVENRAALDVDIAAVFAIGTKESIVEKLEKAGVAFGLLNSVADLSSHPQLRRTVVKTASGDISLVASPIRFEDSEGRTCAGVFGEVPEIGANGCALRAEFS